MMDLSSQQKQQRQEILTKITMIGCFTKSEGGGVFQKILFQGQGCFVFPFIAMLYF